MKKLNINWTMQDYPNPSELKVFGTFVCGGGSTMGYKLAGYQHLGGVEIDKKMVKIYQENHNPKYLYHEDIRDFNKRENLPEELYHLDILDGSPPCTTFSMAGKREQSWGVKKKYNEGQKEQTLDDLVYEYCKTISKLQPKTAILENVPGIVAGRAKEYAINIVEYLERNDYSVQIFSINSATMGVPQSRERIFFIARRNDLNFPPLKLDFCEKPIVFKDITDPNPIGYKSLWKSITDRLPFVEYGDSSIKYADAKYRNLDVKDAAFYSSKIIYDHSVVPTITSKGTTIYYEGKRELTPLEYCKIQSFPLDYNFCGYSARYVCGMSVPPFMIARISNEMKKQWFCNESFIIENQ